MIKFFRKIRQQLLAENRFGKYFTYAIGEIFLVVIGILIALQLNTWKNEQDRHVLEHKILNEMRVNLKMDSIDMTGNIARNTAVLNSTLAILDQLENRSPWIDTMAVHYSRLDNYVSKIAMVISSYENLKSIGFDLIRNDSLRNKIHEVYGQNYPFVVRMETEHMESMKYGLLLPQLTAKIRTISPVESQPNDLAALIDDSAFRETLIVFSNNLKGFIYLYEKSLAMEVELMEMIEEEIGENTKD